MSFASLSLFSFYDISEVSEYLYVCSETVNNEVCVLPFEGVLRTLQCNLTPEGI